MTLKDPLDGEDPAFSRVEWMKARGYSDDEIAAYLKRKAQKLKNELAKK